MISIPHRPMADCVCRFLTAGRYIFLLICTFAFCFQQTVGLVYSNTKTWENHNNSRGRKNLNPACHGFSSAVSMHGITDAEQLALSEDDEPSYTQYLAHTASRDLFHRELVFAQCIRTGYLQQYMTVMQMDSEPLFLLHHQWKSIPV